MTTRRQPKAAKDFGAPPTETNPDRRAEALFLACMTATQRKQWITNHYLIVSGKSGKRYVITEEYHPRELKPNGYTSHHYCAYPVINGRTVQAFDRMVAQKLWIETNEAMFLSTAYRTEIYPSGPFGGGPFA